MPSTQEVSLLVNMIACKQFNFDSAHKLPRYKGPCVNLHGHTYRLVICIEGEVQKDGMVIDFSEIKKKVNKLVIGHLDHKYLNDIIDYPTAENITLWIWNRLVAKLQSLSEITLWETPTSFVTYRGEQSLKK